MIDSTIDNDEFIDAQYLKKKNKTDKIVIIFTSTIWQIHIS